MDPDNPEFRDWAARKMAEILSFEEKERAAAESPPEELKKISQLVEYEVMPIMEAFGVPITRDELSKMFVEWYVRREQPRVEVMEAGHGQGGNGAPGLTSALMSGRTGFVIRRLFRIAKVNTLGGLFGRALKAVLIAAMLFPVVLLPAYFFVATLPAPPLLSNSASSQPGGSPATIVTLTLDPSSPLIAPGQMQNYSLLTIKATGGEISAPMSLTVFSPEGLSFEPSKTRFPSNQSTTSVPVVISASTSFALGPHSVTVEEKAGSWAHNQTFTIVAVPALVVMEHLTYVPQTLNVTRGTTVYWMNLDSVIGCCDPGYHNVVFGSNLNASSPVLKRLGTWDYTFEAPGDFYYYCSIHPFMAGAVTVTP